MSSAQLHEDSAYSAALAYERRYRLESWLALEPDICGIPIAPLTLRRVLYLELAGNPYIAPVDQKAPTLYHLGQFLWVVSQQFAPGAETARKAFYRRLRKVDVAAAEAGITDYLNRSFLDTSQGDRSVSAPVTDWVTGMIHAFASRYAWSAERTLDEPLRQLIQLDRAAAIEIDPKARHRLGNPYSDAAKADWINSIQKTNIHSGSPRRPD